MTQLRFRYDRGGIHLSQLSLWLDPTHAKNGDERVFISHAHSDHVGRHREVIFTDATRRFVRERIGARRVEHVLAFDSSTRFSQQEWQLTLLPAGHILGSAMALIEAEGTSLLYTGDFKLRAGVASESCQPRHADVLIMETTFGRPEFVFPPAAEVLNAVIQFCGEAIASGRTPVLFTYALGKSQELLAGLAGANFAVALHPQVARLTRIYEKLGRQFPAWEPLDPESVAGKVVICPPTVDQTALKKKLGEVRTAVVTGWALNPRTKYRCRVDAAFPLSDHADFPDLIEFVKRVAPGKIFTTHGFAADFARTLRNLGFDAQALSEDEQLELKLA